MCIALLAPNSVSESDLAPRGHREGLRRCRWGAVGLRAVWCCPVKCQSVVRLCSMTASTPSVRDRRQRDRKIRQNTNITGTIYICKDDSARNIWKKRFSANLICFYRLLFSADCLLCSGCRKHLQFSTSCPSDIIAFIFSSSHLICSCHLSHNNPFKCTVAPSLSSQYYSFLLHSQLLHQTFSHIRTSYF